MVWLVVEVVVVEVEVVTSQLSRVSLMVLQVSRRDWGPVLGTDIDRMESAKSTF